MVDPPGTDDKSNFISPLRRLPFMRLPTVKLLPAPVLLLVNSAINVIVSWCLKHNNCLAISR